MSTLKVTNIQNTSGGSNSTADQIHQGRAKSWINFNGTGTVSIRDSFNVSSLVDDSTGNYQVNFSNNFSNANYSVTCGGSRDIPENSRCFPPNIDGMTSSKYEIHLHNDGSTSVDWELVQMACFGDT